LVTQVLVQEIPWMEPALAALRLRALGCLAFLDSAMRHATLGRYSYVAADPFGCWRVEHGRPSWNGIGLDDAPLDSLSQLLEQFAQSDLPGLPPFQGGAIGSFAYEFGRLLDAQPETAPPPHGAGPDAAFDFYDVICAFDHGLEQAWIISTGHPEKQPDARAVRARARANQILAQLQDGTIELSDGVASAIPSSAWRSNFSRAGYEAAVDRVIAAILNGDIFQANLTQCFSAKTPPAFDPFAFYQRLRRNNPATFAAFIEDEGRAIASSSPERFVKLEGRHVETRPIKGTAPRSPDAEEDRRRGEALLASEKDRAENLMIVDLLRNDLSRICQPHSVRTPVLCGLETYAGVHHLVSTVTGELRPGKRAIDLITATFPGGSITGAPKIQAMAIIAGIEGQQRGTYCGSIGFFWFNGRMDSNIAIRTAVFQNGFAAFQVGGGITALSQPAAEYEETLDKAGRIFAAFEGDACR
jgi:para-aminobenzoate synthetase component 1